MVVRFEIAPLIPREECIRKGAVAKFESTYDVITRDVMTVTVMKCPTKVRLISCHIVAKVPTGIEVRKLWTKSRFRAKFTLF